MSSVNQSKPADTCPLLDEDAIILDINNDDDSLPPFPTMGSTTQITESSKFTFLYIDDEGNEVMAKDKAAVLIDETLGIGFLAKCKYEDLLLCGKRYQLDPSKAGIRDYIFAYLHNEDAPDFADTPKASNVVSKLDKPKVESAMLSKEGETGSNIEEGLSLRERLKMSGNIFPFSSDVNMEDKISENSQKSSAPNTSKESNRKYEFKSKSKTTQKSNKIETVSKAEKDYNIPSIDSQASTSCRNRDSAAKFARYPSMDSVKSLSDMSQDSVEIESLDPLYVLGPGNFDIVLVVDTHEHYGQGIPKTVLIPELQKYGILYDVRPLQVGDFTWIAREKGFNAKREVVLDFIVERKRMDDLATSITDGRFREQKFRLCNCGVQNGIYLIEDYGSVKHFSIPEETLKQAVVNTQIIDNFSIKHTKDTKESVAYLSMMTRYLQSLYSDKTLAVYTLAALKKTEHKNNIHNPVQKLVEFQEFNESSVKTKAMNVQEMMAKLLVQIQGMTAEKAAALIQVYPTPSSLYDAYSLCVTERERDSLLSGIKYGSMQRKINDTLSKQVYTLFCS